MDRRYQESLTDVARRYEVRAYAEDARTKVRSSGTLDEVLATVPARNLASLSVYYPAQASDREVWLYFSRKGGLSCKVTAEEPVWAEAMRTSIVHAAKTHKPWWGLFFSLRGGILLYLILLATTFLCALAVLRRLGQDVLPPHPLILPLASIVALILSNPFILNRVLPVFEMVDSGQRARGTTRINGAFLLIAGGLVGSFFSFIFQ